MSAVPSPRSPLPSDPAARALLALLVLLLLLGALLALPDLLPRPASLDFGAYYLAARALAAGRSPYDQAALAELAAAAGGLPVVAYLYPPAVAVLLQPLAALPFAVAAAIWFGLNLLWLALAVVCLVRLVGLPRWALWPALAMALLTPAVQHTLELGQVNTLLLLLVATALLALSRAPANPAREGLAGGALAVAATIKLFPAALLLLLLVRRRWWALAAFGAGLLLLTLVGVLGTGGWAASVEWATVVLPRYAGGFATPNNQSLQAAVARLFDSTPVPLLAVAGLPANGTLRPLLLNPPLGLALGYGLAAAVGLVGLGALVRRWLRCPGRAFSPLEPALLLSTVLLVLPLSWYHYGVLLLLGFAALLPIARQDRAVRLLLLLAAVALAFQRYWRLTAHLGSPLLISFGTLGAALLWLALLRAMGQAGPAHDGGRGAR